MYVLYSLKEGLFFLADVSLLSEGKLKNSRQTTDWVDYKVCNILLSAVTLLGFKDNSYSVSSWIWQHWHYQKWAKLELNEQNNDNVELLIAESELVS